ncbi:MAG TPA: NUDIX domain-containing protein [Candidatus Paceibacterota bacterium]|nr:NUDIX domain-containing protein [Candidatus Paceibacterota bacterium]
MEKTIHGVAVLVIRKDRTVLMQHRDEKPDISYPGYWGYPSGTLEKGEVYLDAACRELIEETAYVPGVVKPLLEQKYVRYDGQQIQRHIYWTWYDEVQPIQCREGQEMRFMSIDEIATKQLLPGMLEVVKSAIETAFPS